MGGGLSTRERTALAPQATPDRVARRRASINEGTTSCSRDRTALNSRSIAARADNRCGSRRYCPGSRRARFPQGNWPPAAGAETFPAAAAGCSTNCRSKERLARSSWLPQQWFGAGQQLSPQQDDPTGQHLPAQTLWLLGQQPFREFGSFRSTHPRPRRSSRSRVERI